MYRASRVEVIYKETQALVKLDHPNIIKLYNTFVHKNFVVIIMEYVGGGDLFKYVKEKKNDGYGLKECEVRELFTQIVKAVNYCHNKHIVHRDLKPENILLTDTNPKSIKLIDFGISGNNYNCDNDAIKAGSLQVLPPEALKDFTVNAYPTTDIWAMGIILYYLIYGVLPFHNDNESKMVDNILHKKVEFPTVKKVTDQCINLIIKLLDKDPFARINMEGILNHPWLKLS